RSASAGSSSSTVSGGPLGVRFTGESVIADILLGRGLVPSGRGCRQGASVAADHLHRRLLARGHLGAGRPAGQVVAGRLVGGGDQLGRTGEVVVAHRRRLPGGQQVDDHVLRDGGEV